MYRISSKTTTSAFLREMQLATQLIQLGLRPPIVQHLCPIGRKVALRIYKENHQGNTRSGMLPYDADWIMKSSTNALHASIFLSITFDISGLGFNQISKAEVLIAAYNLYSKVINQSANHFLADHGTIGNLLEINRAWQLIQQFNSRETSLQLCKNCQSRYIVPNTVANYFHRCPICEVWSQKNKRSRGTA